jgi:hypothetical protein
MLTDRAPWLLTAFLAAVAWAFSHVVDRVGDAPFVVYSLCYESLRSEKDHSVTRVTAQVHNLSKSSSFERVALILRRAELSADTLFLVQRNMADVRGVPPTSTGDAEVDVDVYAAQFTIATLPPLSRFELVAHYRGKDKPVLVGVPNRSGPFILTEETLHTFVLKHEHTLIFGALGLWLILIIALYALAKRYKLNSE